MSGSSEQVGWKWRKRQKLSRDNSHTAVQLFLLPEMLPCNIEVLVTSIQSHDASEIYKYSTLAVIYYATYLDLLSIKHLFLTLNIYTIKFSSIHSQMYV